MTGCSEKELFEIDNLDEYGGLRMLDDNYESRLFSTSRI